MKMKSLLVAGLAVLAMNATAEVITCTSKVVLPEGYTIAPGTTDASFSLLTLTREGDNTDNFTNLQCNMWFPEGLSVATIVAHNDTKFYNEDSEEEEQAVTLVYNNHPDGYFVVALTNATYHGDQIKVTKNPINIARVKFAAAETFKGGDIKGWLKYTDYANNDYVNPEYIVAKIPGESAVADINTGKAVAGVKYYNVAGQAADSAFDGVNIVVTTYADGTQEVVKVVK